MTDPILTFRYTDGRIVEQHASVFLPIVARGDAAPVGPDVKAFEAYAKEKGQEIDLAEEPDIAPEDVDEEPEEGDEDVDEEEDEEEGQEKRAIPDDFPHAKELREADIEFIEDIPEDPTSVHGIGPKGAEKINGAR